MESTISGLHVASGSVHAGVVVAVLTDVVIVDAAVAGTDGAGAIVPDVRKLAPNTVPVLNDISAVLPTILRSSREFQAMRGDSV